MRGQEHLLSRDMKTTGAAQQCGMKQAEFEKLFSEHRGMVYRAAYSVTGNKHEAQDVLQDVFLILIDHGRTLEFTANPAGYLYRMAINKAHERYRQRERRRETDDSLESLKNIASGDNQDEKEMREKLLAAIAQLAPEHAELLVLSNEWGYTDAEIAKMLGKTRGAVAVALHRARARVDELMRKQKEWEL
jgi:RNA polymerase sigma-70 factor (ECF subfamily)